MLDRDKQKQNKKYTKK